MLPTTLPAMAPALVECADEAEGVVVEVAAVVEEDREEGEETTEDVVAFCLRHARGKIGFHTFSTKKRDLRAEAHLDRRLR